MILGYVSCGWLPKKLGLSYSLPSNDDFEFRSTLQNWVLKLTWSKISKCTTFLASTRFFSLKKKYFHFVAFIGFSKWQLSLRNAPWKWKTQKSPMWTDQPGSKCKISMCNTLLDVPRLSCGVNCVIRHNAWRAWSFELRRYEVLTLLWEHTSGKHDRIKRQIFCCPLRHACMPNENT